MRDAYRQSLNLTICGINGKNISEIFHTHTYGLLTKWLRVCEGRTEFVSKEMFSVAQPILINRLETARTDMTISVPGNDER